MHTQDIGHYSEHRDEIPSAFLFVQDMALRLQHLFSHMGNPDLVNENVDAIELGLSARLSVQGSL